MRVYFVLVVLCSVAACAPAASDLASVSEVEVALQSVTMNPLGDLSSGAPSQVTGTAEIVALDNGNLQITMTLNNLEPNASSMGHIHVGDCSLVGPVATGLNAVEADASGTGTSVTEVPAAQLPDSAYIAFHQRGPNDPAGVGSFIACGEIK